METLQTVSASDTYAPVTGRPAPGSKPEGALTYEYNDLGLLSMVTGSRPGAELSMQYYYDALGRLEEVHSPTGIAKYAYHDDSSRASLELPNGVLTSYTYDHLGHLTLMRHKKGASVKAKFAYDVGRSGKRLSVAEEIDATTVTIDYTYDRLGRLTAADRSSGADASYTYDIVGNRLSKTLGGNTTTYTYNALDQLTAEDGTYAYTYTYDGNGNLTKKEWGSEEINYVYDSRNRLRKMYDGQASGLPDLEYAYDYAGNRFAKAEKTGSNDFSRLTFLIDNNNLTGYSQTLLEINHNTGAIDKRYEYGDDLYCQVDSPETPNPSAHFFLYDGLGSTRSLTDPGGAITQSYNYHPFGDLLDYQGTPNTNHLFTGEYYDSNLSYYYLRARMYDPSVGRFTAFDPAEDFNNKLHRYTYVTNDPLNLVDPRGLQSLAETVVSYLTLGRIASITLTFAGLGGVGHVIEHWGEVREEGLSYFVDHLWSLMTDMVFAVAIGWTALLFMAVGGLVALGMGAYAIFGIVYLSHVVENLVRKAEEGQPL